MSPFLTLSRSFTAATPIPPRRILAFTPEGAVRLATGPDEAFCGLSDGALESSQGQRVDVLMSGFQQLEAGAPLTPGARVTSDAQGRAVPAAPDARALALALQDALPGDILSVLITFA